MNEIIIPATKRIIKHKFYPCWEIPEFCRSGWELYLKSRTSEWDKLIIKKPFKQRTTGKHSQNHHINGHIQQICMKTGNDFDTLKHYFKRKAVERGYPFETDPEGDIVPLSESKISTQEATILIETIHQFAAENDIYLIEE